MNLAESKRRRLVTQAEYARHRGVGSGAVSKAVKSGRITLIDGLIDPEVADIQWKKNTDQAQAARAHGNKRDGGDQGGSAAADYMEWKGKREKAEALRAMQNQEREAGNLYYKDEIDRGARTVGRQLRDQLLAVPSRVAAELATLTDAGQIERHLRTELRAVLTSVEKHVLAGGGSDET